jgi:hypothetical protein
MVIALCLFLCRLFELRPSAGKTFKFSKDKDIRIHAGVLLSMLDRSVSYLGPDLDMLEIELIALGKRHRKLGVHAEDLVDMGRAVQFALEYVLGKELLIEERLAWAEVLEFMIDTMTEGMIDH